MSIKFGLADYPKAFSDPRYEGEADLLLNMRDGMQMEIVLSKAPRSDIVKECS